MRVNRRLVVILAAAFVLTACGTTDTPGGEGTLTTSAPAATDTTSAEDTAPPSMSVEPTPTSPDATTTSDRSEPSATTSPSTGLEQPAIWPAADVVFSTPEEAASDFVTTVLEVPANLGEFQQGDSRSGEIEVLSPAEGDSATPVVRSVLLMRQLGPSNGWFILAAVNDNASITSPEASAQVPAGQLTVEGRARGFEASVVVTAFTAGDAASELGRVVTEGGSMETPEPFTVTLDLTQASPGETVSILVRGGTGLETDPGDFGAIPVVVAG